MEREESRVLLSGELQNTRFRLFDMRRDLGLICELAEGEPLEGERSGVFP